MVDCTKSQLARDMEGTRHPYLRKVVDRLSRLPETEQNAFAEQIEADLRERARVAAQLADSPETDLDSLLDQADQEIAAGQVYDLDDLLREP